jgi:hypothetical protein
VRQLDHTIVSTLAHLGCASFEQLHALCFPNAVLATARLKLNTLIDGGVIMHSPWRLPSRSRHSGHVWTITQQGLDMLERAGTRTAASIPDMGRPSTGREYEEWRVRLLVRTFVVRLILEARQDPLCANLSVTFLLAHPTPLGPLYAAQPDALLSVRWEPAAVQAPDWLPWCGAAAHDAAAARYRIYVERQGNVASLDQLIERSVDQPAPGVPLVLMTTADRQRIAFDLLRHRGYSQVFRIAQWGALQTSVDGRVWRDAAGEARKLRLDADEAHELEQTRAFEA